MALKRLTEGTVLSETDFNANIAALEKLTDVYYGRRAAEGLALSAGAGLNVTVATGVGIALGSITVASPATVPVNPSATNYIWLKHDGTYIVLTSPGDPGTEAIFLGTATTNASAVTAVDNAVKWWGWTWSNTYAGNKMIAGDPASPWVVWDFTNKRLGIQNTAPAVPLHVGGKGRFADCVQLANVSAPSGLAGHVQVYSNGGELWCVDAAGNAVQITASGAIAGLTTKVDKAGDTMTGRLVLDDLGLRLVNWGGAGAPSSGAWTVGDLVIDSNAALWLCTASGSPGTWVQVRSPIAHASSHNDGGSDELQLQNLGSGSSVVTDVLQPNGSGGAAWNSSIIYKRAVETKTANFNPAASDSGKTFVVNGASRVDVTLPSGVAGLEYTFICKAATGIRITANTGQVIYAASGVTKSAGYIQATGQVGSAITLVCDGTDWYALPGSISGPWKIELASGTTTIYGIDCVQGEQWDAPVAFALASTIDPDNVSTDVSLTSGRLWLTALNLKKGMTVTNVGFRSGSTAIAGGSNWWFALYDKDLALLAQTADQTSTAWGTFTDKVLALTAAQTIAYSGVHYVGVMANALTPPKIACSSGYGGRSNDRSGQSTTGLTSTAPNPAAAITDDYRVLCGWVT